MICETCKDKSDCGYYDINIKPVLHTEQGMFTNDNYLFALFKCLDTFTCDFYVQQAEETTKEEEAAELLKWVLNEGGEGEDLEYHGVSVKEALNIAVKALEQESSDICEGCMDAKECIMYESTMKRCEKYRAESEGV